MVLLLLFFSCQVKSNSFAISQVVACQAPLSMRFPKQEYLSGWHFSSPGQIFLTQRSSQCLLHWQMDSLRLSTRAAPFGLIVIALKKQFMVSQQHHSIVVTSETTDHHNKYNKENLKHCENHKKVTYSLR